MDPPRTRRALAGATALARSLDLRQAKAGQVPAFR